ncbi:MAG: hypothetical protein Q8N08_01525 [Methanobacteriaceae archaeon]|nr:hypothetical protein [Methanobacteriaceae archaeon]
MEVLEKCLEEVEVGNQTEFGRMSVLPFFRKKDSNLTYLTLKEAMDGNY